MKKMLLLSSLLFVSFNLHAELAGEFEKISGPDICATGNLGIKSHLKEKERVLLFGSSLSFTLSLEDKGESKEVVEGGCTYQVNYEKKVDSFTAKTIRTNCPDVAENGLINESLNLNNDKLTYNYEFVSQNKKKTNYSCHYNRKK
ncbi:hypothetical protein DOM21_06410 [Bacteriovorax stolpii]|uniref:Uncharacterized protein n=1 Tax=Bacteriovorax stolpii TaxID=960 RepID=A0A2K9NTR2_BACTC|nr:hypothetical protein [Bacteriovorax stolpii]AUN98913.1 hypothetical protein C0V70_12535 [Bacteriovorax stolpii]QDK41091.1 hypothetical protein DOM21_06410 [Bacteriovorax stolpii]TDP55562.1 hypothetical protein C8D79_0617 [Bacteriovorax stolpii]